MKNYRFAHISAVCLFILLATTEKSWALQSHSSPEGLYVHQMGHVVFMGALAYLYWHTRTSPPIKSQGWKYLQIFCFFLILWNIIAFTGHQAFEQLSSADFIDKSSWKEQLAPPITWVKVLYYITKMDHFLNVPGLLALVISLRTFYREALLEEKR